MANHGGAYFTSADCLETGYAMPLAGKVVVIRTGVLPDGHPSQLFLCTGGVGATANPSGHSVSAVSLSTGEYFRWFRGDVLGTLKPELLPDEARLSLSQIRPDGARDAKDPEYSGYCYLEDGRYSAGVWLQDAKEAVEFLKMQAPYQHRILICDREDFAVMEMVQGELVHPSQEEMEALRQGATECERGGMTMT